VPNAFASTPEGLLFVASGADPMVKWDGLLTQAVSVGVVPPSTAVTIGSSGTGSLSGTYFAYLRFIDVDGNPSNLSPISASTVVATKAQIDYTNVTAPSDPKIARKQILRNTSGQADTFYVDVDTTALGTTTFSSTKTDGQLSAGTPVPILNSDGSVNANRYTVPPNHKAVIAHHLGRMFAAGEIVYDRGNAQVTFGSSTVTGIGTEWTSSMAGRFLYIVGATKPYQIQSVSTADQTLTLVETYTGISDLFAPYGIRPAPAERRLIYYSEAGLPEAWPATNAISLQEDGDEITGLMPKGSFLYILGKRHIYRFTFQTNPGVDGFVFLSAQRGCLNHRCWIIAEDVAYMLDEGGIHAFSGGQEGQPISSPIQGIFKSDGQPLRINWRAAQWFHAVHCRTQETIRWFVSLASHYLPRHAIVYDYRRQRWWIEEFAVPIGGSCAGELGGLPQVYLGSESRRILAMWQGGLDGPDQSAGTVRGNVTSASLLSLTDASATFAGSGLVGSPVAIVSGRGKGQVRRVTGVSGTTIKVDLPWLALPDSTSVYQLGGIEWKYRTGQFRFVMDEETNARRVEVLFRPVEPDASMDLRILLDFGNTHLVWNHEHELDDGRGVRSEIGSSDLEIDLTKVEGFVQQRLDGHKDFYLDGPRFMAVELGGFSCQEPIGVFGMTIDGVA